MNYNYVCGNFWIASDSQSNRLNIGYKDVIISEDIDGFSFFEERILAILCKDILYVYIINKNGQTIEDALTLISKISKHGEFECSRVRVDDYIYIIDFDCKISCQGRF